MNVMQRDFEEIFSKIPHNLNLRKVETPFGETYADPHTRFSYEGFCEGRATLNVVLVDGRLEVADNLVEKAVDMAVRCIEQGDAASLAMRRATVKMLQTLVPRPYSGEQKPND